MYILLEGVVMWLESGWGLGGPTFGDWKEIGFQIWRKTRVGFRWRTIEDLRYIRFQDEIGNEKLGFRINIFKHHPSTKVRSKELTVNQGRKQGSNS